MDGHEANNDQNAHHAESEEGDAGGQGSRDSEHDAAPLLRIALKPVRTRAMAVCVVPRVAVSEQFKNKRAIDSNTDSRNDASAMNTKPTMPVAMLKTITCRRSAQQVSTRARIMCSLP